MSRGLRLILLGPPGVGKGTQARKIADKYGIPHISTGDILRAEIERNTSLGEKARSCVERGELVPDATIVEIIGKRLSQNDCNDGFLLDGVPRTLQQAHLLEAYLRSRGEIIDAVIFLSAPDDVIIGRLMGRRTCKKCGQNFHIGHIPPRAEGMCDLCGGELYQRKDDRMETTIIERIRVYKEQTAGLVDFYQKKGILRWIEATGSVEENFSRVIEAIDNTQVSS